MSDDKVPYAIPKSSDPNMVRIRGEVVQSIDRLVRNARDIDLDDVNRAITQLRQRDRRLYHALLGNTLLNDIIRSIEEEHEYRNQQATQGGAA